MKPLLWGIFMDTKDFLSDLVINTKYARYVDGRREVWSEIVERNKQMHLKKFKDHKDGGYIGAILDDIYKSVEKKLILPSMRSLQFASEPIERANHRMYNCCWRCIDSEEAFHEIFYLLLLGVGVGYSVQKHHIERLPVFKGCSGKRVKYTIDDSIEGWADAVKILVQNSIEGFKTEFDYSQIRAQGTPLKTAGGFAPGHKALKNSLEKVQELLIGKLSPLQAHEVICHLSNAVLSGGNRRSALISIFSMGDEEMMQCKSGEFWKHKEHLCRANNSVYLDRNLSFEDFYEIFKQSVQYGRGEPGFIWTNDFEDLGYNPCCEISISNRGVCNLTSINMSKVGRWSEAYMLARQAAILGTIQGTYTTTPYLDGKWRHIAERDALLGVSMTGVFGKRGLFNSEIDLHTLALCTSDANKEFSEILGINPAKRVTCIKPEGTTSLVCGTSSGLHPPFAEYYLRRVRVNNNMGIVNAMKQHNPEFIEPEAFRPEYESVITVPVHFPEAEEVDMNTEIDLVKQFNCWIRGGHREGKNTHNVSYTLQYAEGTDYKEMARKLYEARYHYAGMSIFPKSGGSYLQMPFEKTSKETYERLVSKFKMINFEEVTENHNSNDHLRDNIACGGGSCELV